MKLNTKKVAMTFGAFFSGWHLVWSFLVLLGLAQPLLDFIFWVHMLANPYQITGFDFTKALLLIAVTFGIGYVGGWVFAWLWNKLHK